ncbi:hypothetical protein FJ936_09250 [Mesorhizobium sp. B2-4-13]|uniref:hypothetical protein n=1 Tax=Mesorhizobium sp. B2-4-13 TaxID=2589936 RepID=UPI0011534204|nr:hypothetical protein [Mesorhizobium sp. B2-4-13]TPK85714.1 hypothetical protein FJ936_09250 [Mesorhizobium sp. B2-4-13]
MSASQSSCLVAIGAVAVMSGTIAVRACDEFAGRLISSAVAPAIEGLKCENIGKAGLDKPDHHLQSVCYTSSGSTSNLEIVASLRCKTSDKAFVKVALSDTGTANAQVRGADCQLLEVNVQTSGEVGKILIRAFNVNGIVRTKLQEALDKFCQ